VAIEAESNTYQSRNDLISQISTSSTDILLILLHLGLFLFSLWLLARKDIRVESEIKTRDINSVNLLLLLPLLRLLTLCLGLVSMSMKFH